MLVPPSLAAAARAAMRSGTRPHAHAAAPRRSLSTRPLHRAAASSSSCVASSKSYHVLSKAAARIHAKASVHHSARNGRGGGGLRAFLARFAATLRATAPRRIAASPVAFYTALARQALHRAVAPRLGAICLAVDGGVARHLAKHVSPIFRGAVQAFTGLEVRAGQSAAAPLSAQRINLRSHPVVSFARGSFRPGGGFGPRAPLVPRSPSYGAGLQTARNFSSGGRVFDNLVVHAPLALRLAGNELDEKRKQARPAPTRGPRRTTAAITPRQREQQAVQLGRRLAADVAFGVAHKRDEGPAVVAPVTAAAAPTAAGPSSSKVPFPAAVSVAPTSYASSLASDDDAEEYAQQMLSYFEIPPWSVHTRLTMRRLEPLPVMLGNRAPHPPRNVPSLLDDRFIEDARAGLEFEEVRWLKIQSVLRALYEDDPHRHLSITEDGDLYVVLVRGLRVDEANDLLRRRLGFSLDFLQMEQLELPDGLDLSLLADPRSSFSVVGDEEEWEEGGSAAPSSYPPPPLLVPTVSRGADSEPRSEDELASLPSSLDGLSSSSSSLSSLLSLLPSTLSGTLHGDDDEGEFLYDSREIS